jgi:hypothetical protein
MTKIEYVILPGCWSSMLDLWGVIPPPPPCCFALRASQVWLAPEFETRRFHQVTLLVHGICDS